MAEIQSSALETLASNLQVEVTQAVADLASRRYTMLSAIKAQFDAMQTNATEIVDQFAARAEVLASTIEELAPEFDKQASDLAGTSTTLNALLVDLQTELGTGLSNVTGAHQLIDSNFRAKESEVAGQIDLQTQLVADTGIDLLNRQNIANELVTNSTVNLMELSRISNYMQDSITTRFKYFGADISDRLRSMQQSVDYTSNKSLSQLKSDLSQKTQNTENQEKSISSIASGLTDDWDSLGDEYESKIDSVLSNIEDLMQFLKQIEPLLKFAKELS